MADYSYDEMLRKLIKATESHIESMELTIESSEQFLKNGEQFFNSESNLQTALAHKCYQMEGIAPTFHQALTIFTSPIINFPPGLEGISLYIEKKFIPMLKDTLRQYQEGIRSILNVLQPFQNKKVEACETLGEAYSSFYKLCSDIETMNGNPKKKTKVNELLYTYKTSRKSLLDVIESTNSASKEFHDTFERFLYAYELIEKKRSEDFNKIIEGLSEVLEKASKERSDASRQFINTLNQVNTRNDVENSLKISDDPPVSACPDSLSSPKLSFDITEFINEEATLEKIIQKEYAIARDDILQNSNEVFAQKDELIEYQKISDTKAKVTDGFGGPEITIPLEMLEISERFKRRIAKVTSGEKEGQKVAILESREENIKCITVYGEVIEIAKDCVEFA